MIAGLIGKKIGMSQVFGKDGAVIPVTVIHAGPCVVLQRKEAAKDGYDAVQLGFGVIKSHRLDKAQQGHLVKAGKGAFRTLREMRSDGTPEYSVGAEISAAEVFKAGDHVDVTGTSKGKGYAGVMKRHNFKGQRTSHGVKKVHRHQGGTGALAAWRGGGRPKKGKRMAGHLGDVRVTARNLKVVRVDAENNLLLVRGAVPGPNGGMVTILETNKVG